MSSHASRALRGRARARIVLVSIAGVLGACHDPAAPAPREPAKAATLAPTEVIGKPPAPAPPSPPRPAWEASVARLESAASKDDALKALAELEDLHDPRSADALAKYVATQPPPLPRARFIAAAVLAQMGDERAIPTFVWRLSQDPSALYVADDEREKPWAKDDRERELAARLVGELIVVHPEHQREIVRAADDAVQAWAAGQTTPSMWALQWFAFSGTPRSLEKLRAFADPNEPLPRVGAKAPDPSDYAWMPEPFHVARVALRYLGASKDDKARAILTKQLARRPAGLDMHENELFMRDRPNIVRGMALRALASGAADGFAEMGDVQAIPALLALAEDKKHHESARHEACRAVGILASTRQLVELARKIKDPHPKDFQDERIAECRLTAMLMNPSRDYEPALLPLMALRTDDMIRAHAARVMGGAGLSAAAAKELAPKLDGQYLGRDIALAFVLGGSAEDASKAFAKLADDRDRRHVALHVENHVEELLARNVEGGHLARIARNVKAIGNEKLSDAFRKHLGETIKGPGAWSKIVVRAKLAADARSSDAKKKDDARVLLEALGEKGMLDAYD